MRGKVAKRLRKQAYGDDLSPKTREYYINKETGVIVADVKRRLYQRLKKQYVRQTNQ